MQTVISMNNKVLLTLVFVLWANVLLAQKATYHFPKSINNEQVRLTFQKVSSSTTNYYINYKVQNIGEGILIIDRSLTSLEQNDGELHPSSDKYVLGSNQSKTIYNQFRIKPPVEPNAGYLKFNLKGLSYAVPSTPIKAEKFTVVEKYVQTIDRFAIKVMEHNIHPDRIYINIRCSFNGEINSLGNVDLSRLIITGGEAEVVKKGDVIFPGKSYSFSINITPNGEELTLDFNNVLQVMKLEKIHFEPVVIKSTAYAEQEKDTTTAAVKKEPEKVKKDTTKIAELGYSDLVMLKKDIETEMNGGGKPIEMAHEFLMEKGHISTAQVIDVMSVFNLDGSKLKFAKMAYQFTSDKPKYHMVIAKLEYTKNKQAFEEFLEMQE